MITNHWIVCTPKYRDWGWDDEPPEEVTDVVAVEAATKREALVKGVRELRRIRSHWLQDQRSDNANPFTGLTAEKSMCAHGFCWCDICTYKLDFTECPQCLAEWVLEDKKDDTID